VGAGVCVAVGGTDTGVGVDVWVAVGGTDVDVGVRPGVVTDVVTTDSRVSGSVGS